MVPPRLENTDTARQIKRQYLREHLKEVEKNIRDWTPQLNAPLPFTPNKGTWGWQAPYRPPLEQDTDANHMIRRHLSSRRLWQLHAEWERQIAAAWRALTQLRSDAQAVATTNASAKKRVYSTEFPDTAMWEAFGQSTGDPPDHSYSEPDDGVGLKWGTYLIESSVTTPRLRAPVEKEHSDLIRSLASSSEMADLVTAWYGLRDCETSMKALASTKLKGRDVLRACRFCKHLWK